jgi:hypothetical protein
LKKKKQEKSGSTVATPALEHPTGTKSFLVLFFKKEQSCRFPPMKL